MDNKDIKFEQPKKATQAEQMTDIWKKEDKSIYGSEEPRRYEAQPTAAPGRAYKESFDPSTPQEFDHAKETNFNSPEVEEEYDSGYGNSFEVSGRTQPTTPIETP